MRVFVVGGAGCVGSVLVRELLARRHQVVVFDRFFYGTAGVERLRARVGVRVGDV